MHHEDRGEHPQNQGALRQGRTLGGGEAASLSDGRSVPSREQANQAACRSPSSFATSSSSRSTSAGLVMWWSKPDSYARRRSSSFPQPVIATSSTRSPR